jgi:hypothetical protein
MIRLCHNVPGVYARVRMSPNSACRGVQLPRRRLRDNLRGCGLARRRLLRIYDWEFHNTCRTDLNSE